MLCSSGHERGRRDETGFTIGASRRSPGCVPRCRRAGATRPGTTVPLLVNRAATRSPPDLTAAFASIGQSARRPRSTTADCCILIRTQAPRSTPTTSLVWTKVSSARTLGDVQPVPRLDRHAVPRTDVTVLDQWLPLRLRERSSRTARLVTAGRRPQREPPGGSLGGVALQSQCEAPFARPLRGSGASSAARRELTAGRARCSRRTERDDAASRSRVVLKTAFVPVASGISGRRRRRSPNLTTRAVLQSWRSLRKGPEIVIAIISYRTGDGFSAAQCSRGAFARQKVSRQNTVSGLPADFFRVF